MPDVRLDQAQGQDAGKGQDEDQDVTGGLHAVRTEERHSLLRPQRAQLHVR